jgi:energy-coupling factor transporter ATP-binding protein EcfA2
MKLKQFQVNEFRSVFASGSIEVGDVTCLVGKNEAGKTALLKALYRLNPIVEQDGKFDVTDDYPRKEVGNYRHQIENKQRDDATPISATFTLNEDDVAAVAEVFGPKALKEPWLKLSKSYANTRTFELKFDEAAARAHLATSADLADAVRDELKAATTWEAFKSALDGSEQTAEVSRLKKLVDSFIKHDASWHAYNSILKDLLPKFLYFDDYYQMRGHENVQQLMQREKDKKLEGPDYPLLGLVSLARLKLADLLNTQRTVELNNLLEGAGNHLSKQILKYWSQNKHLRMKFDVREARPQDPPHMRSGQNIWGQVVDTVHWATTELGSRSRGFVWFFSFLAWYEDVKREQHDIILLLDEPGLSLHGRAQADLLRYIETELKPHHQVLYTTHSPFMVDSEHFDRVRIVQDKGIDADEPLERNEDGTKVISNVFEASEDSLFPLQGALGYDIHQSLFVGPNSLVVEGPADLLYLKAMSSVVERGGGVGLSDKWTITPVGGGGR